jgi:alpha-galactosidase
MHAAAAAISATDSIRIFDIGFAGIGNYFGADMRAFKIVALLSLAFASWDVALAGSVSIDPNGGAWTLISGSDAYRLVKKGDHVEVGYFGPSHQVSTASHEVPLLASDLSGWAEGESLNADNFHVAAVETKSLQTGVESLRLTLRHLSLPLEVNSVYTAWGSTGVFTRQLTLKNTGDRVISVASCPSLSLPMAKGDYTLRYLYGGWGEERQMATEKLDPGVRRIGSHTGRSTNGFAPWISLRNDDTQVEYLAELAWSGNWDAQIDRRVAFTPGIANHPVVSVTMGVVFDFDGPLNLQPGASIVLPTMEFTAAKGDLDDVSNQLHRYQRQYVYPQSSADRPPLVQFNSWYPFPGKPTISDMVRLADVASALGAEVLVLDSGWYNRVDWSKELGDYEPDPIAFPHGLEELSSYVLSKGMKFGLWMEIENIGSKSHLYERHPEWCLSYNGAPIHDSERCQLDFAKTEVRQWATSTVDRLINRYQLSWIKIDYNLDISNSFDPHGEERPGNILYQHVMHYYAWLDSVRAVHPDLIIENCSSGGLRFDTGILSHTDTNWLSDDVDPVKSLQLGFGCTIQFSPVVCNHWMVGDTDAGKVDLTKPAGWWDFMFRVPMNGQFGISSRVFEWSQSLRDRAAANILLYKQIRQTITGADTYHLTAEPSRTRPTGWMAIEYVSPDNQHAVITAYRLRKGTATRTFKLRGLDPSYTYNVRLDGRAMRRMKGEELLRVGLPVTLTAEWRAAIFKLDAQF